jgi:hypothetical protein
VIKPKTQSADILLFYGMIGGGNIAEKYGYVGLTQQDRGR